MATVGVGVDVVEIDRFAESLRRRPRLAERCFTDAEQAYCSRKPFPPQHYAARFAAKEAVGKALGIGMTRWREVEVVRGRGAPTIALHGKYAERARRLADVSRAVPTPPYGWARTASGLRLTPTLRRMLWRVSREARATPPPDPWGPANGAALRERSAPAIWSPSTAVTVPHPAAASDSPKSPTPA